MATPKNTRRARPARPTVPAAGTRPSVRVDAAMSDDLAVLMRGGASVSDVLRIAVGHLAEAYRNAWASGIIPDGAMPGPTAVTFEATPPRRTP